MPMSRIPHRARSNRDNSVRHQARSTTDWNDASHFPMVPAGTVVYSARANTIAPSATRIIPTGARLAVASGGGDGVAKRKAMKQGNGTSDEEELKRTKEKKNQSDEDMSNMKEPNSMDEEENENDNNDDEVRDTGGPRR
ncbi:MAG: hypothetical protein M1827_000493 [Pycnora praestabilis]|nr:MAG: hypothetical protein M1827_000493 [Pycnora praestabilis]